MAKVRRGDDRAFELLYRRYHRRIHAYVLGMVKDHGRAEDVTQEVFVSALRRMRATERPIAFKPWIYEIAKNACIDAFRRSRRTEEVSYDSDDGLTPGDHKRLVGSGPTPDAAAAAKHELESLWGAFGGLSETHHEILVLRELEGLSYAEIGRRMGMSRPAVESTLFRARRRLIEEYDDIVSGARCLRVQAIIQIAARSRLGARDTRRLARHLAHCQPCRRDALEAGLDRALIARPPVHRRVASRVAGWLPFPVLAWFRRGGDGAASPPGHAAARPHLLADVGGPRGAGDWMARPHLLADVGGPRGAGDWMARPHLLADVGSPRGVEGVRALAGAGSAPGGGRGAGLLSHLPLWSDQISGGWGKLAAGGALLVAGVGAGVGVQHAVSPPAPPAASAPPTLSADRIARTAPARPDRPHTVARAVAAASPTSGAARGKPARAQHVAASHRRATTAPTSHRAAGSAAPSATSTPAGGAPVAAADHTARSAGDSVRQTTSGADGTARSATDTVDTTVRQTAGTVDTTVKQATGTVDATVQHVTGTVDTTVQQVAGTLDGTVQRVTGGGPTADAVQQATGAVQQTTSVATATVRQTTDDVTQTVGQLSTSLTGALSPTPTP